MRDVPLHINLFVSASSKARRNACQRDLVSVVKTSTHSSAKTASSRYLLNPLSSNDRSGYDPASARLDGSYTVTLGATQLPPGVAPVELTGPASHAVGTLQYSPLEILPIAPREIRFQSLCGIVSYRVNCVMMLCYWVLQRDMLMS